MDWGSFFVGLGIGAVVGIALVFVAVKFLRVQ